MGGQTDKLKKERMDEPAKEWMDGLAKELD